MSFEWQDIEVAAKTLEVDLATMQKWIEQGHAPSRETDGQVQVLIEFPDDEAGGEEAEGGAEQAEAGMGGVEIEADVIDDGEVEREQQVYAIEQSHQREIQLAGGMVAAWKQLAEAADQELARSRRNGVIAWMVTGVLVFVLLVSWWNLSGDITAAEVRATSAETNLKNVNEKNETQGEKIDALSESLEAIEKELNSEQRQAHATKQRLTGSTMQINRLNEQLESAKQTADLQSDTFKQTQQTLLDTIKTERERVAKLEQQLEASNKAALDLQKQIGDLKKQFAEAMRKVEGGEKGK